MTFWRRLRSFVGKRSVDRELDAEVQFHLDCQAESYIAQGMRPAEARRRARLDFGGPESIKEECRGARTWTWLETTWQDVRHAWRNFRRAPAFSLAVVAIMAAGIGATAAVFSVVDRVLFRGHPYAQAERIVSVGVSFPIMQYDFLTSTSYRALKRDMPPFDAITTWSGVAQCDLTEHDPVRLGCARVESTFLPFFGIQPALGRSFLPEEDLPGAPRVALVTDAFWKTRFGGRPEAVGRTLSLDGTLYAVIGVLPASFELPNLDKAEVVIPQTLDPSETAQTTRPVRAFARLKPGITPARARQMLDPFYELIFRTEAPPQYRNEAKLLVRPLREFQSGDVKTASWTLAAAVTAILLIACANVANLLLARAVARRRDLAVRAALGAARPRLVRQGLTESLLLALAGAAAGCLLARLLLRLFVGIAPAGIPFLEGARLDGRVLAFTLSASLVCGLAFGLAPALTVPGPEALSGDRVTGGPAFGLRRFLVAAQLAISLALVASAALLLVSLRKQTSTDLGVSTESTVTAEVTLGLKHRTSADRQAFLDRLAGRLRLMPGLEAVAYSDSLPPGGISRNQPFFALRPEGKPPAERGTGGVVVWRSVSPDYFRALRIPILRGRPFTEEDNRTEITSLIVSQSLARRLWPGEDALGKRLQRWEEREWFTVVGVARDVRNAGLTVQPNPEYYASRRLAQESPVRTAHFLLRGSAPPAVMGSWLRAEVAALDPSIPVTPRTLEQWVGRLAARPRFQAWLLGLFALTGLALAAAGLFGLVSYLVEQRSGEIGLRLALGATPAQIRSMVLGHAARWTAAGALAGLAGALVAARALHGLLYQVSPSDPRVFAAAALVLATVAQAAAWLPARRAARTDPITTLRHD